MDAFQLALCERATPIFGNVHAPAARRVLMCLFLRRFHQVSATDFEVPGAGLHLGTPS